MLAGALRLANESHSHIVWTLQTVVFVLYGQVGESACKPIKSVISIPYTPLVLLDISPGGLQRQMFWGLISSMQVSRVGVPDIGQKLLLLRKKLCMCEITLTVGLHTGGGVFGGTMSLPLLPISLWTLSFVEEELFG